MSAQFNVLDRTSQIVPNLSLRSSAGMHNGVVRHTGHHAEVVRGLPEETPVAMVYNGETLAVVMATPSNLTDLATGFTFTEGIATCLPTVNVIPYSAGVECSMELDDRDKLALQHRQRRLLGASSCGICGIRSVAQAVRVPQSVPESGFTFKAVDIPSVELALRCSQPLHDQTRGVHGAAWFIPGHGIVAVREDVGRHNALDKLIGHLVRTDLPTDSGAVVLTSRVSIEMVQKCAALGASVVIAVSTATALATRAATAAGITLVCNARNGRFDVLTHPERVSGQGEH